MKKMYNTEPNKTVPIVESKPDAKKITDLENKVRQQSEQISRLNTAIEKINKILRRQNSEMNSVVGRVNRLK